MKTKKCVGRVKCFVKAIPKEDAVEELVALGIPCETQRFAIVTAYQVTNANKKLLKFLTDDSGEKDADKWVDVVKDSCMRSGACRGEEDWNAMLKFVQRHTRCLAADNGPQLRLKHDTIRDAGTLDVLAVPVSSNHAKWYWKEKGPVTLVPQVMFDPRRAKVTGIKCADKKKPIYSAECRRGNTTWYFTDTYSRSGEVLYDLDV